MGSDFDDDNNFDDSSQRQRPRQGEYERPRWRIIDTVVRGENAAVEVSILELEVPRFSFRVGTAHFPQFEGDPIKVSPRLTIFNVQDAAELLTELASKYLKIREDKIEELEDRKDRALSRLRSDAEDQNDNGSRRARPPEVVVRRTKT